MRPFHVLVLLLLGAIGAPAQESVSFIKDDFARAIAQAKEKNRPIFVEAWAPW